MSKRRALWIEVKYHLCRLVKLIVILLCILLLVADLFLVKCLASNSRIVIQPNIETVSIDSVYVDEHLVDLDKVPLPLVQSFLGHDWTFRVDPGIIDEDGWSGFTNYYTKEIVVANNDSVLHEFGHYLQWALNYPAIMTETYLAEAENVKRLLGDYSTKNSREYFAECFSFWITEENEDIRDVFCILAPNTSDYLKSLESTNWGLSTSRIWIQKYNWKNVDELYASWEAEELAWKNRVR